MNSTLGGKDGRTEQEFYLNFLSSSIYRTKHDKSHHSTTSPYIITASSSALQREREREREDRQRGMPYKIPSKTFIMYLNEVLFGLTESESVSIYAIACIFIASELCFT